MYTCLYVDDICAKPWLVGLHNISIKHLGTAQAKALCVVMRKKFALIL